MATNPQTFDVLGVPVHALSTASAIDIVRDAVRERNPVYMVFCTVSSVLSARKNPEVMSAFADGIVTPDGMPLVWIGKRSGHIVERVYGPDFMVDLIRSTGDSLSHFFYGGAPGIADEMSRKLRKRFPELRIAGTYSPPFGMEVAQRSDDIDLINASGADVVWVGIGHPKQDLWMQANRAHLEAPVLAGVGAAFDFHAGVVKEAPAWMKRSGLQWLHRLANDPKRLWRRYLLGNTEFLYLLAKQRVTHRPV